MKNKNENSCHLRIEVNRLALGLLLVAVAVFLALDACGVGLGFLEGIPLYKVALGILLLAWFLSNLIKLKISQIFYPAAFLFMLFEKHIAVWIGAKSTNLMNNWLVLLIAILLSIGFSLLRPRRHRYGGCSVSSTKSGGSLGSSTVYIDCTTFVHENIVNELGSCQVYFSNVEQYHGGGTLTVRNELGALKIHVPSAWRIEAHITNELGASNIPENNTDNAPVLTVTGHNELGNLTIVRV